MNHLDVCVRLPFQCNARGARVPSISLRDLNRMWSVQAHVVAKDTTQYFRGHFLDLEACAALSLNSFETRVIAFITQCGFLGNGIGISV